MAQSIGCDLCQQETAVMLETRVETGEVIAVGAACLIPFYAGALKAMAAELDGETRKAYETMMADLAVEVAGGTVAPPPDEPHAPPPTEPIAGTEDASVNGEGITVTTDGHARARRARATGKS